jgi:hypothetical protein
VKSDAEVKLTVQFQVKNANIKADFARQSRDKLSPPSVKQYTFVNKGVEWCEKGSSLKLSDDQALAEELYKRAS